MFVDSIKHFEDVGKKYREVVMMLGKKNVLSAVGFEGELLQRRKAFE